MTKKPNVLINGTGGTISCIAANEFDFLDYPISVQLLFDELAKKRQDADGATNR